MSAAWAAAPTSEPPASSPPQVAFQDGDVRIEYPEGAPSEGIPEDLFALGPGAALVTGPGSSCEVLFGDIGGTLRLEENARAVLVTPDPPQVKLERGTVYLRLQRLKKGSTFRVESPTVVTSVRGTGWVQGVDSVHVFESSVSLRNASGAELEVPEGRGLSVGPDGSFGALTDLTQEMKDRWGRFTEEAGSHAELFASLLAGGPKEEERTPRQTSAEYSGFGGPDITITATWWEPVDVDLWVEEEGGVRRPATRESARGPGVEVFRPWDLSGLEEDRKYYVAAYLAGPDNTAKARVTVSVSVPGRGARSKSVALDRSATDRDFWIAFSVDTGGRIEEIGVYDTSVTNYLVSRGRL